MSVETFSSAGIKHILPEAAREMSTVYEFNTKVDTMDTLVALDGSEPTAHTAFLGKVGNAYVSGTQEHTAVKVRDLAWSVYVESASEHHEVEDMHIHVDDRGYYTNLTKGQPKDDAILKRDFPQPVLAPNHADKVELGQEVISPNEDGGIEALFEKFGDKTVYLATSEPVLSGRVFDNKQDAREDGRILAELAQNGATMSGQDRMMLKASRPAFAASLEADKTFKDDMDAADSSVAAMAMSRGTNVSTTTALALMAGAKSGDDPIVAALSDREFTKSLGRFGSSIEPSAVLMDLRQGLGRDERAGMMTLTAAASAVRKGREMFADVKGTASVLKNVETTLSSSPNGNVTNLAKFMALTEKVVDESRVFIERDKAKTATTDEGEKLNFFSFIRGRDDGAR